MGRTTAARLSEVVFPTIRRRVSSQRPRPGKVEEGIW